MGESQPPGWSPSWTRVRVESCWKHSHAAPGWPMTGPDTEVHSTLFDYRITVVQSRSNALTPVNPAAPSARTTDGPGRSRALRDMLWTCRAGRASFVPSAVARQPWPVSRSPSAVVISRARRALHDRGSGRRWAGGVQAPAAARCEPVWTGVSTAVGRFTGRLCVRLLGAYRWSPWRVSGIGWRLLIVINARR